MRGLGRGHGRGAIAAAAADGGRACELAGHPTEIVAKQPTKRKAFWEGREHGRRRHGPSVPPTHVERRPSARAPAGRSRDGVDDPWLVTSFEPNDLELLPPLVKAFEDGLPVLPLPRELPAPEGSMLAVLGGVRRPEPRPSISPSSRGCSTSRRASSAREERRNGRIILFRAAGSAGGRFPLEVYVVVPGGAADLPPGVHAYRPVEHALVQVGPPPAGGTPALVVTGVPVADGLELPRARLPAHLLGRRDDALPAARARRAARGCALGSTPSFPTSRCATSSAPTGSRSFPSRSLAFGDAPPGWTSANGRAGSVDAVAVHFPLVTATHWAGISSRWGEPWRPGDAVRDPLPDSPPVNDVIYRRGSTRRMDASRGVPRDVLDAALAVALRGIDLPHFVAVHDVDGVPPGLYRWPDLTKPVLGGNLRDELHRVCGRAGARRRRRLRRDHRRRHHLDLRSRTATCSSPPASSRGGCTSPPSRSATAPRA